MTPIKPMLAAEADPAKLVFPLYATPKIDGVRAMITADGVMSRSWKLIPNEMVQLQFGKADLIGLDGELIVGDPAAADVYRTTQSVTSKKVHPSPATFFAFDLYASEDPYSDRLLTLRSFATQAGVQIVPAELVDNAEQLRVIEERYLDAGYEGLILRSPTALYKHGRSTVNEGGMLKLKRFVDSEAVIIGVEEEMANGNVATLDAFGRTERSSHQENLTGKGRMGALVVRDVVTGVEFKIGTGFTAQERADWWMWFKGQPDGKLPAVLVKYKHFPIGAKDKPRFPTYLGRRDGYDL